MACTRLSLCAGAGPELAEQADIARSGRRGKGLKSALPNQAAARGTRDKFHVLKRSPGGAKSAPAESKVRQNLV